MRLQKLKDCLCRWCSERKAVFIRPSLSPRALHIAGCCCFPSLPLHVRMRYTNLKGQTQNVRNMSHTGILHFSPASTSSAVVTAVTASNQEDFYANVLIPGRRKMRFIGKPVPNICDHRVDYIEQPSTTSRRTGFVTRSFARTRTAIADRYVEY